MIGAPAKTALFTTDVMVEGIDFDLSYASGADLGWKIVAVNVSDIAAMGGRPRHALATLVVPRGVTVAFVDDLLEGLLAAAARWEVRVAGGDISEGDRLSVGIALLGAVNDPILRSGAAVDDVICVTGALGGSAAALEMLRAGTEPPEALHLRHLRPAARIEEGATLAEIGVTSMIDISDGLAVDLGHLCDASRVGCRVETELIPLDPALSRDESVLRLAIVGGEDFELLCTLPSAKVDDAIRAVRATGTELTRIGTIVGEGRSIGDQDLDGWRAEGWDHLRSR